MIKADHFCINSNNRYDFLKIYFLRAQTASRRYQHWALIWQYFSRWRVSNLVEVWLHWTVYIMEVTAFSSYWNRHLLHIQICFPCLQYFCQKYDSWPHRMFYTLLFYFASLVEPWLMHYINFNIFFTIIYKTTIPYMFISWYLEYKQSLISLIM